MKTWTLKISIDGGNFTTVNTGLIDYQQAEAYCKKLYGEQAYVVGQEFKDNGEDQNMNRKRSWLWG